MPNKSDRTTRVLFRRFDRLGNPQMGNIDDTLNSPRHLRFASG